MAQIQLWGSRLSCYWSVNAVIPELILNLREAVTDINVSEFYAHPMFEKWKWSIIYPTYPFYKLCCVVQEVNEQYSRRN
jgi:hypothetical protein